MYFLFNEHIHEFIKKKHRINACVYNIHTNNKCECILGI